MTAWRRWEPGAGAQAEGHMFLPETERSPVYPLGTGQGHWGPWEFLVASGFSESETPSCSRVGRDVKERRRQEKVALEGERANGTGP